jgi:hypothetical protein
MIKLSLCWLVAGHYSWVAQFFVVDTDCDCSARFMQVVEDFI